MKIIDVKKIKKFKGFSGLRAGFEKRKSFLWSLSHTRPQSQRFFKISFENLSAHSRIKILPDFGIFFVKYLGKKIKQLARLGRTLLILVVKAIRFAKAYLVKKLVWSRGRLGQSFVTSIVMTCAFFVFMFGKVLNSSRLVNSQEIAPGYLSNTTDIIPQKNTALTTIPESRKQAEVFKYTVEGGDTLSSIGKKFKISLDALEYVNGLSDTTVLKVGQELIIPPTIGLIHKVARGDTLSSIAQKYDVPAQAIADINYILDTSKLAVGTELIVPDAKIPQPTYIPVSPSYFGTGTGVTVDPGASKGWCLWPTTTRIITQAFWWQHTGLDIAVALSQNMPPIFACASGVVVRAGWDPTGFGLHVRIDHGNGYETIYAHMSRIDVGYGERVDKGEVLGLMGSTGHSTGPHLHFVIKYKGVAQNPLNYIN